MRAVRFDRYGPAGVLRIDEVPEPVPGAGEVKVRIRAASLNPVDWKIRAGAMRWMPMFRGPPRGTGCDLAGEIVGVGRGVAPRHVGERVFGALSPLVRDGTCAEYAVLPAASVAAMPDGLDFVHAAALPIAGGTALQAIVDEARLDAGQRVLIVGAAGGVGHFAVQIAKHVGACVVALCSAGNTEFVRGLGADEVIDYAREDFSRREDRFDAVFDAAGASSFAAARTILAADGCYINTLGTGAATATTVLSAIAARFTTRQRVVPFALKPGAATWQRLAELVRAGALRPHVERTVTLDEVADAQGSREGGHGRGKVVVVL
ncbi:MAG TPA: NAD(P)-dependent alcohol dehydrogenase [Casimicrobiaceae bacterium]|nr:NAD(P)-dependent alcohol dehydrogenase [Casimicrobiaceae bacterium]